MTFQEKCQAVWNATAQMNSSKELCLHDAAQLFQQARHAEANVRLEKAAQYAWGFNRPDGWTQPQPGTFIYSGLGLGTFHRADGTKMDCSKTEAHAEADRLGLEYKYADSAQS